MNAMTEKEKMLAGMTYSAVDQQLLEELNTVKEIIHRYNSISPSATKERLSILKGLLGHIGDDEIIINQLTNLAYLFNAAGSFFYSYNVINFRQSGN